MPCAPAPSRRQESPDQPANNVQNRAAPSEPTCRPPKRSTRTRAPANFPPLFWDRLSKVALTPRALRELDRRNAQGTRLTKRPPFPAGRPLSTTVARFARRGGPNLCRLRGYSEAESTANMPKAPHSSTASSRSRWTQSTGTTPYSRASKRSSAYDANFERHLIENNIYPEGFDYPGGRTTPEPVNLDDIVQGLANPQPSLSPSKFPRSVFKEFKQTNSRVISEARVMSHILPIIEGNNKSIPSESDLLFTNLGAMTDGATVIPKPDFYDGSYPLDISAHVREALEDKIIPTAHDRAPALPNLFVEAKGPAGGIDVAKRQACLDGAVGARAMHALQNYGETAGPLYDGKAYSFSSVYHAGSGSLHLYAHFPTAREGDGQGPEYHMTQIDSWAMTGNVETFRRGATAFRNSRKMAQEYRERFIQAANSRAQDNIQAQPEADVADGNDAVNVLESVEEVDVAESVEAVDVIEAVGVINPVDVIEAVNGDEYVDVVEVVEAVGTP